MDQLEEIQVEVSRTFEAPLELLWKAWTEPEHFMKWYGPKGFTAPTCEIDLREGGRHLWSMLSPDGKQMYSTGTYKEVVPMERLVYTDSYSDAEGNIISSAEMGMPTTMDVTVTFEHADGKTTVTVSHVGYGASAEHAGMGWEQAFEKLASVLAEGN
ncbi:MAG: SRPBCC domain-containing protein [Chloroflexi bacterium]|nr:SRPBCC domain-containing protein [Chloroflexota bacterium]MCH8339640.1 SRPBCC domain-containing protein [Chloroflexota bacterium]